jgi:hypothetical protein
MRAGILISALSHVLLVLLALFGTPKLFDSVPSPSIEVDLVPSEQVDPPPKPPEPEKDNQAFGLPAAPPSPPPAPAQPPPDRSQQAALAPQPPRQQPQGPIPPGGPKSTSIFDPVNIPALLDLPNAPSREFDSEATVAANLSATERDVFKAHLRKCWKLPAGAATAANPRIVVRLYLQRDARLASDPVLISVSSPRHAIAVVEAAKRAIKDCQPFAFLPADKYSEWRMLELSITPQDMAGG